MATPKQTFALFCATKLDVRGLNLTVQEASKLIGMVKSGKAEEVITILQKMGVKGEAKASVKADYQAIYDEAHKAGMEAARKCVPTPMVVERRADPFDDTSKVLQSWNVPGGCCGFASIKFKGNTSFARWAIKNKLSDKSCMGGHFIWVGTQMEEFAGSQSVEIKSAYAYAFARVLNEKGIKANVETRLD